VVPDEQHALSEEVQLEGLPDDMLSSEEVTCRTSCCCKCWGTSWWSGTGRWVGVALCGGWWRALHDGACQRLHVHDGVTDEVMHALCGCRRLFGWS